jgi:membrane-associated progesterone receptor component
MTMDVRLFTPEQLSQFNGSDPNLPIYLAIKGTGKLSRSLWVVFDVSQNRSMYHPGAGYHIFAGKDASRVR